MAGVASELGAALTQFGGAMPSRDPLLGNGSGAVHAPGVPAPDSAYHYPYGLFEEALDKDAHLHALIGQRKAAVLAWERGLVAADASPEARAALELVRLGLGNIAGGFPVGTRFTASATPNEAGLSAAALKRGHRNRGNGDTTDTINGVPTGGGLDRDLWELLDALPYGLAVSEVVWEWVEISNQSAVISDQCASATPDVQARNAHLAVEGGKREPFSSLITDHCSLITKAGQRPALPSGRYLLPRALLSRHPRRFIFSPQGELRLLTAAEPVYGEAVPARKFIVFAPYGRHENPYGTPLLRSVWWASWFKRQALKFWLLHCEKYGMPTAVLTHPAEAGEEERKAFRRVVGSIQQETGLVVPEGVELSLLEASRSGGPAAYQALIELCNSEMSKAILGQTLTVDTPQGAGAHASLAMARVHEHVREDITRLDAQALTGCINSTLVRWIVELNSPVGTGFTPSAQSQLPLPDRQRLGAATADSVAAGRADAASRVPTGLTPAWTLTPPCRDDLRLQLEIDRFFAEQGLPVSAQELYRRYGRSASVGSSNQ